jgi:hypothetical protein
MSDEKFEEFLQREGKSYNEPPVNVPRDEMFAAITAARQAERLRSVRPVSGSRFTRTAWMGMAATLILGVAIGTYASANRGSPAAPVLATTPGGPGARPAQDTTAGSYAQAATDQMLRAEALLTAYAAAGKNTAVDKQMSSWARDILENTRLLLDSPAADDPARKRLLQDLELVLVQLVERSPTAGASEERSHIDRSMERTQVLPRLRSALPAGRNSGI